MTTTEAYLRVAVDEKVDQYLDIVGVERANIMISEDGRRLWVCTENGTVLRVKAGKVTLDDKRLAKDDDG
jgi:hypothetical protein